MSLGLVGRKVGMTRIFTDDGESLPVTVLDVADNRVSQQKSVESDGYTALQVVYGKRRPNRITKAVAGHLAKAGVEGGRVTREFRVTPDDLAKHAAGSKIGVDLFQVGQFVDVTGTSIGKGFAGVIKRHNFSSNRASHGNSISHNTPGSMGQAQDPGRVFPGKKGPGHLGAAKTTVAGLEIVRIDAERQILWIKGAVPGHRDGHVIVKPAAKFKRKAVTNTAAQPSAAGTGKTAVKKK